VDQLDEIKSKIDIVNLISEYIPLKKAGRNFKANCPFHSEKTPSFIVSPELQIFKCFGCAAGGDAFKFLQLYEKMDFWESVEFLAKRAGVKLARKQVTQEEQIKRRLYEINSQASEFYHYLLTTHPVGAKALDYVLKRGIKKETIKLFKLGFSPPKAEAVAAFLRKKGYTPQETVQAGLTFAGRDGRFYDRFHNRLVFPLLDHRGNPVGFSGRTIPGISLPDAAKYINTPETLVYHKSNNLYGLWLTKNEIAKKNEAILVEGEFDLISPFQAGLKNLAAVKGTSFTEDQGKLLRRFAETAVLALDSDLAGTEAIKRSAQIAETIDLAVKVAPMPPGFKDPDDLAQKEKELLFKTFAKPIPIWDFILEKSAEKYNLDDPNNKKKILKEVLPLFAKIENEVIKNYYFQKLADLLKTSLEAILLEGNKINQKNTVQKPQDFTVKNEESSRRILLEKYFLSIVAAQEKWKILRKKKVVSLINSPVLKKIIKLAVLFFKKNKKGKVGDFFQTLPEELKPAFEEIYLTAEKQKGEKEENLEKIIIALKREEYIRQRREISQKLTQAEIKGDETKLNTFQTKFVSINQKIKELGEG